MSTALFLICGWFTKIAWAILNRHYQQYSNEEFAAANTSCTTTEERRNMRMDSWCVFEEKTIFLYFSFVRKKTRNACDVATLCYMQAAYSRARIINAAVCSEQSRYDVHIILILLIGPHFLMTSIKCLVAAENMLFWKYVNWMAARWRSG